MHRAKKIWGVVSTVLVTLVVLCAVFLMGARLLGYEAYNILSPSMEPKYRVGDLIYVKTMKPAQIANIQPGQDITFVINENLDVATHRVSRVDRQKQCFYTKGLTAELEDGEPVHFNNVIGVVHFHLPLLGHVSRFIQKPPGMYIAIATGVVMILLVFLPDMLVKKRKAETPE